MVTLVGMQSDFGAALKDLIELEYDAAEAYEVAIEKLVDEGYKEIISLFMHEHLRHIDELTKLLHSHGEIPPTGPNLAKQWITTGKVVIGSLLGDRAILMALRSNEVDTNAAYERLTIHEHRWPDGQSIIDRDLMEEHKHKKWLEMALSADEELEG